MNAVNKELVSIIIRTHSPKNKKLLEEAIKSVLANKHRPIEIVIVVQTENDGFIAAVDKLAVTFKSDSFQITKVVNPTSRDERAKNLNLGLLRAQGRYVGFLDDDDIYCEGHIDTLLEPLKATEDFAWSFGDVALVHCKRSKSTVIQKEYTEFPFRQKEFSLTKLFQKNFIPTNSYLLDTQKITPDLLRFDESYTVGEDYIFLLRLASLYLPFYIQEAVSEYRVFDDFSNSTIIMNERLSVPDKAKIKAWSYAQWKTEVLKKQLMPDYSSGLLSLKTRKYIFYRFPALKIIWQYKLPLLRKWLTAFAKNTGLIVLD